MELDYEGYKTSVESNGRSAMDRIIQENYDLVLLDIMLPGIDGIEICRRVRELSNIPIIMLTAKDEIQERVLGLDIGADDYLTKPFSIQELLARIRAALRKHKTNEVAINEPKLQVQDMILYPKQYYVEVDNNPINLSKKEYELLEYLVRNKQIVITREQILQKVWGYDYLGDSNVVDVYIRYLRCKLDEQFNKKYIHTVRGVGYVVKD